MSELVLLAELHELLKNTGYGLCMIVFWYGIWKLASPEDDLEEIEYCDSCRPKAKHHYGTVTPIPTDYNQRWFEYNKVAYSGPRFYDWDEFTRQCIRYESEKRKAKELKPSIRRSPSELAMAS